MASVAIPQLSPIDTHKIQEDGSAVPTQAPVMSQEELAPLLISTATPTLDLTPEPTSTYALTSTSNDFGEFVDASASANRIELQSPLRLFDSIPTSFDPISPPSNLHVPFHSPSPLQTTPPSFSSHALPSSRAQKTNLVDDILKHEHGSMALFSDPAFLEKKNKESLPLPPPLLPPKPQWSTSTSRAATPTPAPLDSSSSDRTDNSRTEQRYSSPASTSVASLGATLSHPLFSKTPSPSRSSPRPPPKLTTPQALAAAEKVEDETEIIAKHLGLIDDGYFVGREPAEALTIPIPPSRSRSRSSSGFATGFGGGGGGGDRAGHGVVPSSPTRSRTSPVQVAPPIMSSGGEWDDPLLGGPALARFERSGHHLDSALDSDSLEAGGSSLPKRTTSYGALSGIWGLLRGSPSSFEDEREEQARYHSHPHVSASPPPIQPTIVEGQAGYRTDPALTSSYSPPQPSIAGVHGHTGRPLPRARPSLESIQHRWKLDSLAPHPLGPPASSISRGDPNTRSLDTTLPQPVNFTHTSAFAPAAPPPESGVYPGSSSSFKNTTGNPFATHSFSQISGAPGFRPEMYDWDKGFSEELEQELRGDTSSGSSSSTPSASRKPSKAQKQGEKDRRERGRQAERYRGQGKDAGDGGSLLYQTLGSKFGFGGWGASSSSVPGVPHRGTGPVQPGRSDHDRFGHARSATAPQSQSKAAGGATVKRPAVSELIDKKLGGVELKARKETTLGVLSTHLAEQIRPHLPPLSRLSRSWTLLYSLDQHGISLNTLYTNCETPQKQRKTGQPYVGMGGALVVLRDADADAAPDGPEKHAFGAFVAEGLGRKAKGFYGGGDSFLWKYDGAKDEVTVFKATGRNSYFTLSDSDYIAFGGGSTSYGLWVNSSLLKGSSAPCPTFGNEVLCSQPSSQLVNEVEFECVGLEVWGVGPN